MVSSGADTVSDWPPLITFEEKISSQSAPAGKYRVRVVAFSAVTGATRYFGPSMYWSLTPTEPASAGNSHQSGRIVGTPVAETLAASSAM